MMEERICKRVCVYELVPTEEFVKECASMSWYRRRIKTNIVLIPQEDGFLYHLRSTKT